ncbi:MAG: hypothetical protein H2069_02385 [Legionella sp.]|nr:hypothetical protein [Legionella sp.]
MQNRPFEKNIKELTINDLQFLDQKEYEYQSKTIAQIHAAYLKEGSWEKLMNDRGRGFTLNNNLNRIGEELGYKETLSFTKQPRFIKDIEHYIETKIKTARESWGVFYDAKYADLDLAIQSPEKLKDLEKRLKALQNNQTSLESNRIIDPLATENVLQVQYSQICNEFLDLNDAKSFKNTFLTFFPREQLNEFTVSPLIPEQLEKKGKDFCPNFKEKAVHLAKKIKDTKNNRDLQADKRRLIEVKNLTIEECACLFLNYGSTHKVNQNIGLYMRTTTDTIAAQPYLEEQKILSFVDFEILKKNLKPFEQLMDEQNISKFFYNFRLHLDYGVSHPKSQYFPKHARDHFLAETGSEFLKKIFAEYSVEEIIQQLKLSRIDQVKLDLDNILSQWEIDLLGQSASCIERVLNNF